MGYLNSISRTYSLKKCLLAIAACGLIFPGASVAQLVSPLNSPSGDLNTSDLNTSDLNIEQTPVHPSPIAAKSTVRTVLADGTYLFGQAKTPNELGMTYAVLSVKNNQTVGAFYQPRSSFDCFSGQISPDELSVSITDSYSQTIHPYEIAVSLDGSLVAGNAAGAYTLEGFYRIDELSNENLEMLAVCQADLAE